MDTSPHRGSGRCERPQSLTLAKSVDQRPALRPTSGTAGAGLPSCLSKKKNCCKLLDRYCIPSGHQEEQSVPQSNPEQSPLHSTSTLVQPGSTGRKVVRTPLGRIPPPCTDRARRLRWCCSSFTQSTPSRVVDVPGPTPRQIGGAAAASDTHFLSGLSRQEPSPSTAQCLIILAYVQSRRTKALEFRIAKPAVLCLPQAHWPCAVSKTHDEEVLRHLCVTPGAFCLLLPRLVQP